MRNLFMSLVVVGMMAGAVYADDTSKPNLIFNSDTCMLRITPQDGQLLDGWSICVTGKVYIGAFHESEDIECDQVVAITEHYSIDMSPYLDNCDAAVSDRQMNFGTLKSYYR